jgi:hypothetical protein
MSRSRYLFTYVLVVIAVLSSCKQEKSEAKDEGWNPQAKSYLDDMGAKEASNIEKGWAHVEGDGYHYDKPEGWTEAKDMEKGVYFLLTSSDGGLKIRLTSRYVESIPEGVEDLRDLAQLQYSSMGMPEALEETREIEVADGDALEALISIRDSHLRVRYFSDMFQHPENQRMWLLLVESQEKSRLDSHEVQKFLETFRVEKFQWVNRDDQ